MKESELGFWKLLNSSATINVTTGCHVVAVAVEHRSEGRNITNNNESDTNHSSRPIGSIRTINFQCDDGNDFGVTATYVIDASYDGDIMVMAGVDHTSGREARSEYNESLAGVLSAKEWSNLESFSGQNMKYVDPYNDKGDLVKYINPDPLEVDGSRDGGLMAFQYLACISSTPGNMVPFYAPDRYNPDDFLLLLRQTEAVMENGMFPDGPPISYFGDLGQCYDPVVEQTTGNRDCMYCCGTAPVDADQPDLNREWAKASYNERLEIAQQYRYYIQGSLYFMANDPRMPTATRTDAQMHGYCKDEYSDYGNFPPQLYVRISNRLLGQEFLTQNNISSPQIKADGVAMGCWVGRHTKWMTSLGSHVILLKLYSLMLLLLASYYCLSCLFRILQPFDQHTVTRRVVKDDDDESVKVIRNEGFFRVAVGPGSDGSMDPFNDHWYDVPFGVMVPRNISQANNLLVPVAISVSSVAYSSTRIENMFMDLGSAAGVAVASLLERRRAGTKLGDVPTLSVQEDVVVADVQNVLNNTYGQKFHGTHAVTASTRGNVTRIEEVIASEA